MVSINNQLVLDEEYDENYQPTQDEIFEYAQVIGIEPYKETELLFIARQGIVAPLPPEWKPCQDPNGEIYYFNFSTGDSVWDHPCDEHFREMVIRERGLVKNQKKKKTEKKSKEKKKEKKPVTPLVKDENDGGLGGLGVLRPIGGKLGPISPNISNTHENNVNIEKYNTGKGSSDTSDKKLLVSKDFSEEISGSKSDDDIDDETDVDFGINSALAARLENMDIDNLGFNDESDESEFDVKQSSGDHLQLFQTKSISEEDDVLEENYINSEKKPSPLLTEIPDKEILNLAKEPDTLNTRQIHDKGMLGLAKELDTLNTEQIPDKGMLNFAREQDTSTTRPQIKSFDNEEVDILEDLQKKQDIEINKVKEDLEKKKVESIKDFKSKMKQEEEQSQKKIKAMHETELKNLNAKLQDEKLDEEAKLYEEKSRYISKLKANILSEKQEENEKLRLEHEKSIEFLKEKNTIDYIKAKEEIESENKTKLQNMKEQVQKEFEEKQKLLKVALESEQTKLTAKLQQDGGTEIEKLKEKLNKEMDELRSSLSEEHTQRMNELHKENVEANQHEEQQFIDSLEQSKLKLNFEEVRRRDEGRIVQIKGLEETHKEQIRGLEEKHQIKVENLREEFKKEIEMINKKEEENIVERKTTLAKQWKGELDEIMKKHNVEVDNAKLRNNKEVEFLSGKVSSEMLNVKQEEEETHKMSKEIELRKKEIQHIGEEFNKMKQQLLKEIVETKIVSDIDINKHINEYSTEDFKSIIEKLKETIQSLQRDKNNLIKEIDDLTQKRNEINFEISESKSNSNCEKGKYEEIIVKLKEHIAELEDNIKRHSQSIESYDTKMPKMPQVTFAQHITLPDNVSDNVSLYPAQNGGNSNKKPNIKIDYEDELKTIKLHSKKEWPGQEDLCGVSNQNGIDEIIDIHNNPIDTQTQENNNSPGNHQEGYRSSDGKICLSDNQNMEQSGKSFIGKQQKLDDLGDVDDVLPSEKHSLFVDEQVYLTTSTHQTFITLPDEPETHKTKKLIVNDDAILRKQGRKSDYKLNLKDLDANMAELDKKLKSYKAFNDTLPFISGSKTRDGKERKIILSSDDEDFYTSERKIAWKKEFEDIKPSGKKMNAFEKFRKKHTGTNFKQFQLQDEEDTIDRAKLLLKSSNTDGFTYQPYLDSTDDESISLPESIDDSDIKLRLKCLIDRHKKLDDEFELENDLNKLRQQKHDNFMSKINRSKRIGYMVQPDDIDFTVKDEHLDNNNDKYFSSCYLDTQKKDLLPDSFDNQKVEISNGAHNSQNLNSVTNNSRELNGDKPTGYNDIAIPKPRSNLLIEERLEKKWREYFGDRLQPSYTQSTPMSLWGHASAMEHLHKSRICNNSPASTEKRLQSHSEWLKCVRFDRESTARVNEISSYPSPWKFSSTSVFTESNWNPAPSYRPRFEGVNNMDMKLHPF